MAKIAKTLKATRRFTFGSVLLAVGLVTSTVLGGQIPSDLRETHVLNRLAFGPRPGDLEAIKSKGVEQYIEEQLSPYIYPFAATTDNKTQQSRNPAPKLPRALGGSRVGLSILDNLFVAWSEIGRVRFRVSKGSVLKMGSSPLFAFCRCVFS